MKKSRKILAALLTLSMAVSLLASCGGDGSGSGSGGQGDTSSTGEESKTFVMAVSENMKSLDPHYQTTITGKTFTQMYLESLILYDETTGEFFPWL